MAPQTDREALLLGANPAVRGELASLPSLDSTLEQVWAKAIEGGEVGMARDSFFREIGRRLPPEKPAQALESLCVRDLYLAAASSVGDDVAIVLLQQIVRETVAQEASRMRLRESADEAEQMVLEILFVSTPGRAPAIAQYSGRGDLRGWVRVIAVRELLRLKRRSGAPAPDEGDLPDLVAPGDDPELEYLRGHYRTQFRQAFRDALSSLPDRERTVLKQHLIDGLTIDALGALYGVHRATAARWIVSAQERVAEECRSLLRDRLKVNPEELSSIARLVRSNLEVSLRNLLKP